MYRLLKEINFCYGHRLLDYEGRCAHPHGHNGRIQIELGAQGLDKRGMVYDFGDVKELIQEWVDRALDHRRILKKGDPLVRALRDLKEPVYEMDANPTAESLAELIWRYAKSKGLPVTNVTFWETPSSNASFGG